MKTLSIYPQSVDEVYIQKVNDYIRLAKQYGFEEIFTSVHLPELTLSDQFDSLKIISEACEKYEMSLIVDIGGESINYLLDSKETYNISFIRLDCDFEMNQVTRLYEQLDIDGFIINASMYSERKVDELIEDFKKIDEDIEIRACHNFYVRKETGLSGTFAYRQSSYFNKHNIPVYYFVPSYSNPRCPLYEGLCTIEKHRYRPLREIITDLYINYDVRYFMFGDMWLSEDELKEIQNTFNILSEPLSKTIIEVSFYDSASEEEKQAVLKEHVFRYDSPDTCLRSESSRKMAQAGKTIKKNNTTTRKAGSITIDNELYKRYSGEVQVILKDMDKDERVNVVGYIDNSDDLIKLSRYKEGIVYKFVYKP